MDLKIIVGYFATGIVWGVTNAYMELGSKNESEPKTKTKAQKSKESGNQLSEGVKMFSNLPFLLPFLLNQAASIFNNFLVANSDLSVAVPVVNCITFITTFITERLLKRS